MEPSKVNAAGRVGSWATDDLLRTASAEVGVGADTGLPDEVRFVASVAKLLRKRIASGSNANDPVVPAVFLLCPNVDEDKIGTQPKRQPRLSSGLDIINGRLWFVSAVVRSGKYIDITQTGADAIFHHITDDLKLGNVAAIYYEPESSPLEFSYYPKGLEQEENFDEYSIDIADVSMEKIIAAIDITHSRHLITPEVQSEVAPLWVNRAKWYPVQKAEASVQHYVHVGLSSAFPTCTVRPEQTQATGRLDLEIVESDFLEPSKVINHAVIELKVLRSYGSTGDSVSQTEIDEWVTKGLKQAAIYRNERNALKSGLFCFDMRKTDTGEACFSHVQTDAVALEVHLRRWYLYATSEQLRDASTKLLLGP
jgi:hypothetical protein